MEFRIPCVVNDCAEMGTQRPIVSVPVRKRGAFEFQFDCHVCPNHAKLPVEAFTSGGFWNLVRSHGIKETEIDYANVSVGFESLPMIEVV